MMVEAPMEEEGRTEARTKENSSVGSHEYLAAAGDCRAAGGKPWTADRHGAATGSTHLRPGSGREQDDQNGNRPAATHVAIIALSADCNVKSMSRNGWKADARLSMSAMAIFRQLTSCQIYSDPGRLFG